MKNEWPTNGDGAVFASIDLFSLNKERLPQEKCQPF